MQAFICEVVRARTKLGIAIAAKRPMMATTIIISTSVKPALLILLILILAIFAFLLRRELSNRLVIIITTLFTNCPLQPRGLAKQGKCQGLVQGPKFNVQG